MKARGFLAGAGIALGLLSLGGCVSTPEGWRILSPMRPLPHAAVQRWRRPETASGETRPRPHYAQRRVARPVAQAKETPQAPATNRTPTSSADEATSRSFSPPAQAAAAPTVTLADANISRVRVIETLNQAEAKLSGIDRQKLDGTDAVTYDQAEGFLRQARKAADENDYVAAWGLAHKASILADKLPPSP
jgi:hypothetical protein